MTFKSSLHIGALLSSICILVSMSLSIIKTASVYSRCSEHRCATIQVANENIEHDSTNDSEASQRHEILEEFDSVEESTFRLASVTIEPPQQSFTKITHKNDSISRLITFLNPRPPKI